MQDVTALSTFNPHGGPVTHSSQDRNLTLLYTLVSKLFLTLGFVCNSRVTFLMLYSGIRRNTYSRCSEPLSHSGLDFEQLSIRLEPLIEPSYLTLDIFYRFNSRGTLMLIHGLTLDCFPHKHSVVADLPRYLFVNAMEFPKKG